MRTFDGIAAGHRPVSQRVAPSVGFSVRGAGVPVVLLHSSLSHKMQWRALEQALSTTHKVVAIDLHGYGDTAFPAASRDFGLRDEVALVESVLERVVDGGERFHLVGHSYGGAVALRLAHALPARVLGLTLYEPVAFHLLALDDPARVEIVAVANAAATAIDAGRDEEAAAGFVDYWSGPGSFAGCGAARQQAFVSRVRKVPLDFQAVLREPLTLQDYRALELPVGLIAGLHSRRPTQAVAERLQATLAAARLHRVPGGHMAPVITPDLVNPIIVESIRQGHGA